MPMSAKEQVVSDAVSDLEKLNRWRKAGIATPSECLQKSEELKK
jgi:hypothetical protein|tara:strand:- start:345 stop:476 length:132 start_codon:yes stop_codon:yes gene_type:complete